MAKINHKSGETKRKDLGGTKSVREEACNSNHVVYQIGAHPEIISGDLRLLLGYANGPEVGQRDWMVSLIHPEDSPSVDDAWSAWLKDERTVSLSLKYRVRRGDGTWAHVEDRLFRIPSGEERSQIFGMVVDITGSVQAEIDYAVSKATFDALVENLPVEVWVLDSSGRYRSVNSRAKGQFGDVTGKLPSELGVDDDTVSKWQKNNERALNGELVLTEEPYVRQGAVRIFQEILAPIWHDGEVFGAIGANIEVTERKRDEEHRLASEQRHQSLLNAVPDRVFLQESDGTYIDFHDSGIGGFVVPPSEFLGRRMQEVLPKEMLEQVGPAFDKVVETREPQVAEYRSIPPRQLSFMEARMVPCGENQVLTIVRNVTDRRVAEIILEHQRSALESIVTGAPLETALNQIMIGLEESFPGTFGSLILLDSSGETVEVALAPSIDPDYSSKLIGLKISPSAGSCGTACYRREPVMVEDIETSPLWENYRPLAQEFGFRACWSYPIISESGAALGSFAMYYREPKAPSSHEIEILREATRIAGIAIHRHQIESELRRLNDELERRVEERTEAFRISNEELESFSYSVAHDLRAPLRTIAGFSQILADEYGAKLDRQGRDYLQRSIDAATSMGQVVDALLELSRINRGDFTPIQVNLSKLAQDVAAELTARQSDLEVRFAIQSGLKARADSRLMMIALENLIGNALKFTRDCSNPSIEVGLESIDGKGAFFVRDNGIGFDPSFAEKLFNPFVSLHPGSPRKGEGIGLATVHRIINRHGGKIWAEGEVGNGATFYFTLGN